MKTLRDTFYYSDDWFADDPASENKELALASMQLIASCVEADENGTGAAFLKSMGFEEVGFSDFTSTDPDDCNYTWARKTAGDKPLIAVVIQSASADPKIKNKGWKQNFSVNDPESADPSGEHYAYAKVADKVVSDIAGLAGGDEAVFWITGQSRGGAIANVLAARLQDRPEAGKVFAYTFESPATVDADATGSFKNIHNYVCSDDIVTLIPVWGMTRYGVTHDLKTKETDEGIADALTELGSEAAEFKARIVTEDVAARLAENFEAKVPARADYTKINTVKWTDADGKSHELSYSYQEAFVKLMDLVFRENSSGSLMEGLAGKRGALEEAITHLTDGVKLENSGSDPCAEYWAAAQGLHSVLSELTGGEMPVNEEDLYEVVSFAGPVLITIPEGGGEPDTELLTDVIGYSRELTYSHSFDTLIARLKVLAPAK
jgi:hypothetical protein